MRRLTAAIAGIAVAASVLAPVPAAADSSDAGKIIAGIAAAAIIAKAIDNRREREREASSVTRAGRLGPIEQDGYYDGRRVIEGRILPYDHGGPKAGRGYKKQPLPQSCLRVVETDRGDRLAYGTRCLQQSYRFASKLPESCETLVRTRNGLRSVYGARCLERDGWRVARR